MPFFISWFANRIINIRALLHQLSGWFRGFGGTLIGSAEPAAPAVVTADLGPDPAAPVESTDPEDTPWWLRPVLPVCPVIAEALGSRLQDIPGYSVQQRQALAYQRGRHPSAIRRGERGSFSGPRVPLKNRCYVVLRGPQVEEPFFTWQLGIHQEAVYSPDGQGIASISISHGFHSQAEALAFCLGAGLRGLPTTR